jgi:hypothetical protein
MIDMTEVPLAQHKAANILESDMKNTGQTTSVRKVQYF